MGNLCALFKLFGAPHFIYLILALAIGVVCILFLRKLDSDKQRIVSIALLVLCGVLVVVESVGRFMVEGVKIGDNLPFNPIHVFVYLMVFAEIRKSLNWVKFGYFLSSPLCLIGLFLVPNFYLQCNSTSLAVISYFLLCGFIIAYCVLKMIWSEEFVELKDVFNAFYNFIIVVGVVHIINVIFRFTTLGVHADYFGTMGENYDVFVSWVSKLIPIPFVNVIPLFVLVLGIAYLMYIPYSVIKNGRAKKSQYEELVALGNAKAQMSHHNKSGSHILVRSETKATPNTPKNITNKSSGGFVSLNKEIDINKK
ncbi:MAG: YwaF family protein [Clostridia bacterium]|nr:YwaF family protein [Clostridia bacterium]